MEKEIICGKKKEKGKERRELGGLKRERGSEGLDIFLEEDLPVPVATVWVTEKTPS